VYSVEVNANPTQEYDAMMSSIKKLSFGPLVDQSSQATRQRRARRRRQLCVLEGLEERVLQAGSPTVFMVENTSNNAAVVHSLPWAIKKADANPNPAGSLIEFKASVFKATTPRTIKLASTLVLSETKGPEVIDGPGASAVTISGDNSVEVFSVETGVTATLSGLTVSGGNPGGGADGGGISNAGALTVTNSIIESNTAGIGGGIYNVDTLTVTGSIIQDNTSESTFGGAGIYNGGTLAISDSTIADNTASQLGNGGGIANGQFGTLTVTSSTIETNTADEGGGGIENSGTVTVFESTIAGNSAVEGAGIDTGGGTVTVIGSTIANNREALDGGGIAIFQSTVLLVNSTIAGNSASRYGGGIAIENGGRSSNGGSLLAVNCTIAYNGVSSAGAGAGLHVDTGVTTTLENTIVADNTMPSSRILHLRFASEIVLAAGATNVAGSYNLIGAGGPFAFGLGTGGSGGLTNGIDGNQVGVEALLGLLAGNGGPTQTIALLSGSPAIDAGNIALAHYDVIDYLTLPVLVGTGTRKIPVVVQIKLTTDQRGTGFPRTHNGTVDIGAFEVQPS
jgi:hypothetical protein